jgi:hypothetical protein
MRTGFFAGVCGHCIFIFSHYNQRPLLSGGSVRQIGEKSWQKVFWLI